MTVITPTTATATTYSDVTLATSRGQPLKHLRNSNNINIIFYNIYFLTIKNYK